MTPRRLILSVLATTIGALAFSAAPALAAQEKPEVSSVEDTTAVVATPSTEALLHGVLNPAGTGEEGTYKFLYKESKTGECEDGSETAEGISPNGERDELPAEPIGSLSPGTEYAVCLRVENNAKTEAETSLAVSFTTPVPPETPITREAKSITGTTATLNGELNPLKSATAGYQFRYNTTSSGTGCEGGTVIEPEPGVEKTGKAIAVSTPVTGLMPGTEYTVCVVAINNAGEAAVGVPSTFTTPPVPKIDGESTSAVTSTGAKLEAQIDPNNQTTTYSFEYSTKEVAGVLQAPITTVSGAKPLAAGFGDQSASVLTGAVLAPGTTYFYRVVATNGAGPSDGAVQSFTTVPQPTVEAPTLVTADTATLNGKLTPLNENVETKYHFIYNVGAKCVGGGETPTEEAGKGTGIFVVPATQVTALQPNATYAVCLVASNSSGFETSAPVAFKTLAAPPKVDSESTSAVTSTGAKLDAQVNPNNQATTYSFEYSTKETGGVLEAPITTVPSNEPLKSGFGDQTASVFTGTLAAGTTYFYRVVATSGAGPSDGAVQSFTTVPQPTAEAPTLITADTATLNGKLTSLNKKVPTEYWFEYALGAKCTGAGTVQTAQENTEEATGAKAVSAPVTGLQPNATYTVCLVATNSSGSETSAPVSLPTHAAVPTIESEGASGITPFEATLEAQINPNNEKTSYTFEYSTGESGGKLSAPIVAIAGVSELSATYGNQTASVSTAGHPLTSNTIYHFRVKAKNAAGEATEGAGEFTTETAKPPAVEGEAASIVTATEAHLQALVNPDYQQTAVTFEYATEESVVLSGAGTKVPIAAVPAGPSPQAVSVGLGGVLEQNTTYYFRVIATNATGTTKNEGVIQKFKTLIAPALTTAAAENVTESTASLSGTVNPRGAQTSYHFVYVDDAGYKAEESTPDPYALGLSTEEVAVGAGNAARPAAANLTELAPGTTYHFALVATNAESVTVTGSPQSFTTPTAPPQAFTGAAGGVTQSAATVTGTIDTQGLQTSPQFQLGTSPESGPVYAATVVSESGTTVGVSTTFGELQPGTTYYYRTVASSRDGTSYGNSASFTTAPPSPPSGGVTSLPLLSSPQPPAPPAPAVVVKPTKPKPAKCKKPKKLSHGKCVKPKPKKKRKGKR